MSPAAPLTRDEALARVRAMVDALDLHPAERRPLELAIINYGHACAMGAVAIYADGVRRVFGDDAESA